MNENFVITIGRQLGSGGLVIGKKIADLLNIAFFDKELLILASKESGINKEIFESADEKKRFSFLGGLFNLKTSSNVYELYSNPILSNENLFKIQSDIIQELVEKQSCVFVGRCADYVLRNHPRCINVFLCADIEDRMRFVSEMENIPKNKVKDFIEKTDKKRASYYNYYSNKVWGEANSYHLCINTSILGFEESTKLIIDFARETLKFDIVL
jgi:cytidylate kinase